MGRWRRCLPTAAVAAVPAALLLLATVPSRAVPSFARQTGMECAGCHVGAFGPQLTPAGIRFKIGGYTDSDGKAGKLPLSAMMVGSYAHTRADREPAAEHLKANDNATLDEVSVFLAGRLAGQVGSFVQVTHSGIDHGTVLDQLDLRWARPVQWAGKPSLVGVSVNNNPSVQDPFNTLPAWSFPFFGPEAGFGTGEAASLLDGGLAQRVLGASAYAFWDQSVYAELGSYRSLSPSLQRKLGAGEDAQRLGGNAYWRLAYFKDLKGSSFSLGTFGWHAALRPDREPGTPADRFKDWGVDAAYQFLGTREHVLTASASHLRERRTPGDGGEAATLRQRRLAASYHFRNTWGASVGLFDTRGKDPSAATNGQLFQLDWTPWGKEDAEPPSFLSLVNLRLGAQYWRYGRFEGERAGASAHNTLGLFAWLAL